MKYRIYAILLLLIVVFNILRYEIPYIEYAIFKPYIAKNLCINKDKPKSCCEGKCYREKQIKQISEAEETEKENTPKISKFNEIKEFLVTPITFSQLFGRIIIHHSIPQTIFTTKVVFSIFIPPQA